MASHVRKTLRIRRRLAAKRLKTQAERLETNLQIPEQAA